MVFLTNILDGEFKRSTDDVGLVATKSQSDRGMKLMVTMEFVVKTQ